MRTIAFWVWFAIAVLSLGRLWSTVSGGVLSHMSGADVLALAALTVSLVVIGRVQRRAAQTRQP